MDALDSSLPDGSLRLDNLFAAHLDALIANDEVGLSTLFKQAPDETRDLLHLATHLHVALKPVAPSDEFIKRLRNEFIDESPMTLLLRWRKLPPRYQTAAKVGGATLTAGLMLLAARRALSAFSTVRSLRSQSHASVDSAILRAQV